MTIKICGNPHLAHIAAVASVISPGLKQAVEANIKLEGRKHYYRVYGASEEAIEEWEYRVRQTAKETVLSLSEAVDKCLLLDCQEL